MYNDNIGTSVVSLTYRIDYTTLFCMFETTLQQD